jgi:hypothetical protein
MFSFGSALHFIGVLSFGGMLSFSSLVSFSIVFRPSTFVLSVPSPWGTKVPSVVAPSVVIRGILVMSIQSSSSMQGGLGGPPAGR